MNIVLNNCGVALVDSLTGKKDVPHDKAAFILCLR